MPTYRVFRTYERDEVVYLEAEDEEEARKKAKNPHRSASHRASRVTDIGTVELDPHMEIVDRP